MCIYIYSPPSQMMLFHTAYTTKRQISARPCLDLLAPLIRDGHVLIEGCMGYLWPKKNDWDIWDIWNIYGYLWPTNMSTSGFFLEWHGGWYC